MQLTDSDIGEFNALWQRETGQALSHELAKEYAEGMVGLVALIVKQPLKYEVEEPP